MPKKSSEIVNGNSKEEKKWIQSHETNYGKLKIIKDIIHGYIPIYYPINLIIDTSEFQRLRRLKQLGCSYYVYPTADHNRFVHSLGVYHLARCHVNVLAKRQPNLRITDIDILCVCIAGLIHDLGHGPLSHTYDGEFLKLVDPETKWRHEECSKQIFKHMLENNKELKLALDEYLSEKDYIFIEELIDPPKEFMKKEKWLLKGRGEEKSFLYDIISNKHDSIDVDKFDYFLRDSTMANVKIQFGIDTLELIRYYMEVRTNKLCGYSRLTYAKKIRDDIKTIMETREKLHQRIYQHKTTIACEIMILDAMKKASGHLKGRDGKLLAHAHKDIVSFLQLDDTILEEIRRSDSTEKDLIEARKLLELVERRKILRFVGRTYLTNQKFLKETSEKNAESIKEDIRKYHEDNINCEVFVTVRQVHRGMGTEVDPITEVLFFNETNPFDTEVERAPDQWLRSDTTEKAGKAVVYVYVQHNASDEDYKKVFNAFVKVARVYNLEEPTWRFRSNKNLVGNTYGA